MRVTLATIVCLTVIARTANATPYTSPQSGFSLTIPDDWESAPDLALRANATPGGHYEAAFAPKHRMPMSPYVMVSTVEYPQGKEPSEQEMRGTAAQMLKGVQGSAMASGATTMPGAPEPEIHFDAQRHQFSFSVMINPGGHPVTVMACAYFGRSRCAFLNGYVTPIQFAGAMPVMRGIAESFQFDPASAYDPSAVPAKTNELTSAKNRAFIFGALLATGGVFVGIAVVAFLAIRTAMRRK